MSTPTVALHREFRRLPGPTGAILGAAIAFGLSTLAAVRCAQVAYHQISHTLTAVFHVSGVFAEPPEWVAPLLVDLSAVSSVLCTFVALSTAAGAVRIVLRPEGVSVRGRFPFPGAYRGFFTMFGLMGTLVGFTISFSPLDAATIEQDPFAQSEMLLAGLATALYSTLVAIVLAYGVCPPIEGMFRGLRRMRTGERDVDMPTAFECLTSQAGRAAATLAGLEASAAQAAEQLDIRALAGQLGQLHAVVESTAAQLAEIAKRVESERTAVGDSFADITGRLRVMDDRIARVTDTVRRTEESHEKFEERFHGFLNALRQIPR